VTEDWKPVCIIFRHQGKQYTRLYDFLTSGLPYLPHLVSKPSKQQKRVSLVLRRDRLKQKEKALVCMTREGLMEAQWIADRAALQQTPYSRPQTSLSQR
jgi:hypothetical protein